MIPLIPRARATRLRQFVTYYVTNFRRLPSAGVLVCNVIRYKLPGAESWSGGVG